MFRTQLVSNDVKPSVTVIYLLFVQKIATVHVGSDPELSVLPTQNELWFRVLHNAGLVGHG